MERNCFKILKQVFQTGVMCCCVVWSGVEWSGRVERSECGVMCDVVCGRVEWSGVEWGAVWSGVE